MTKIRRDLRPTPDAGRAARGALDGWLTNLVGEQKADDVRLAATELVNNAVRHGALADDDVIVLSGLATEDIVRIIIEQPTPVGDLRVADPVDRGPGEGGFGLKIVDEISSTWGVFDEHRGAVWFEVDRDLR
jgi:anti-sigma regulatory factor (Ser/Thr protein kinase)